MPVRKSEKRFEERLLATYKQARQSKGYFGSFANWEYLLRRLGAENARLPRPPTNHGDNRTAP
jgi:hypothetical protein